MSHIRDRRLADELANELMRLNNGEFYVAVLPTHVIGMHVMRQVTSVIMQREQRSTTYPGKRCIQNERNGTLLFITPENEEREIRGRIVLGGYGLSRKAVEWVQLSKAAWTRMSEVSV